MGYDSEDAYSSADSSSSSSSSGWKDSRAAKGTRAVGKGLSAAGDRMLSSSRDDSTSRIGSVQYRKGGKVRKTGPAVLHKNERVIPAGKRKKVEKLMKRSKMRMKGR